MLMHNLQWPVILLYSETEIIIMHLHFLGHVISGYKARQSHQARYWDWAWRDRDLCELCSSGEPCGCGFGVEEISPALLSALSSAIFLGALVADKIFSGRYIFLAASCLLQLLVYTHPHCCPWFSELLAPLLSWQLLIGTRCISPTATPRMPSLHPFQNPDLVPIDLMSLDLSSKYH